MKEAIIGYITGMINNHQRAVDRLVKLPYSETETFRHKNYINELSDLLNFVDDIPEEKQESITVVLNGGMK